MSQSQVPLLLEEEITVLEQLIQLSLDKKKALLEDDRYLLELLLPKEEALLINLQKLDAACSQQVPFFLSEANYSSYNSDSVATILEKIKQLSGELKNNYDLNRRLLDNELNLIQSTLNSLLSSSDINNPGVYSSSGKIAADPKRVCLVNSKG